MLSLLLRLSILAAGCGRRGRNNPNSYGAAHFSTVPTDAATARRKAGCIHRDAEYQRSVQPAAEIQAAPELPRPLKLGIVRDHKRVSSQNQNLRSADYSDYADFVLWSPDVDDQSNKFH